MLCNEFDSRSYFIDLYIDVLLVILYIVGGGYNWYYFKVYVDIVEIYSEILG